MSKGSSKIKKAIDKIVKPKNPAEQKAEKKKEVDTADKTKEAEAPIAQHAAPDLGQKTMPGILALRKKFGK
jgi:hypothetical protein